MSAPDSASDQAPKIPLAHGAVIHVAQSLRGIHMAMPAAQLEGMSKPDPTRQSTLKCSIHNASLHERGSLTVWLDPLTPWHAAPSGKRGAQPVYSHSAIQVCLTVKVLFGLPIRQTTGFVASLLKLAGLDQAGPGLLDALPLQTLAVRLLYLGSDGPSYLLIDSIGTKVCGEGALSLFAGKPLPGGKWHARRHGGARRRVWRKVHLAVDKTTSEARPVEI